MKNIFNRDFFVALARKHGLSSSIFSNLSDVHCREILIGGEDLQRVSGLQQKLEALKAMGDDQLRYFYLELPRPTLEEWGNCEEEIENGNYENYEEFYNDWKWSNPTETKWVAFISSIYMEYHVLSFRTGPLSSFCVSNWSRYGNHPNSESSRYYRDFLDPLYAYLNELFDAILADVDGFNAYVAQALPYQLREGVISRKVLHQILPGRKIQVLDEALAIEVLESCANDSVSNPLESMTIRTYCKYYRIAHEAFLASLREFGSDSVYPKVPDSVPMEDRDIYYYEHSGLKHIDKDLDVDSPEDFPKFAYDHYGELGFSRLNIHASTYNCSGWKIVVSCSYSAYATEAINVATALYRAGTPLQIYDADKFLELIREEGNVRFVSCSYHDYLNRHKEASVMELPWEDECSNDPKEGITLEQYHQIVAAAQWEDVDRLLSAKK